MAADGRAVDARLWDKTLAAVLGDHVELAMWHAPGELVTKSSRGLCLVPFDGAKQTALRAQMDKVATCLAGGYEDVLLHPHVALPAGSYSQVSTQNGRMCVLSTAGEITCCGPTEPALPPPPKGVFTQVATGGKFACALDAKGAATCLGRDRRAAGGPVHEDLRRVSACVRRALERRARVLGCGHLQRRAAACRHVHRRLGRAVQHVRRAR